MMVKLKDEKYQMVKYDKGSEIVICKCGSQVLIDGEAVYKVPIGFGFHPDGKFYSDYIQYKGWYGECLECRKKIFAYKSKRAVSKRIKI